MEDRTTSVRLRLVLKPQARADVNDILLYTRRQWGVKQRDRYKAMLDGAFRELIDFPELGRSRDEVFVGCRSWSFGQHVVYYHVAEHAIVVARVLHVRQDAAGKVEP